MTRLRHHVARAARFLARLCTRWAERLDPPAIGDDMAAALRACEVLEHLKAGRIRKRRGEADRVFYLRVARGDFEILNNVLDFNIERAKRMQRVLPKGNVTTW